MIVGRLTCLSRGLAAGLLFLAAGCSEPLGVNEGRVQFVLSSDASSLASAPAAALQAGAAATDGDREDRPSYFFQSASVTLSSILARNLEGVLVNVTMDLPVTIDVVTMEGGRDVVLPTGELLPATYDQVVVVMTEVQVVTHDGTIITIEPPGGGWTAIIPICPFDVPEGGTASVGIQFDLRRSFSWRDNRYHFQPRLVCDEEVPVD